MDINKIEKVLQRHINKTLDSDFIKSLAIEIFVANDVIPDPAVLGAELDSRDYITNRDPGDEHVEPNTNAWYCNICGENTDNVEYDYLGSGTNHLGCELRIENERLRLAEELVPNQDSKFIYESPDGGKTVTKRPFGGGVETRVEIDPKEEFKKLK